MRFCHYPSQAVQKYVCIGRADRRSADDSPGFVLADLGTGGSQYKSSTTIITVINIIWLMIMPMHQLMSVGDQ